MAESQFHFIHQKRKGAYKAENIKPLTKKTGPSSE